MHAGNGFTEFQSAANETWYVGFNRRGRCLPGAGVTRKRHRRRRRRCYQFSKTDFPYVDGRDESNHQLDEVAGDAVAAVKLGQVNWYAWVASRRRTDAAAVT